MSNKFANNLLIVAFALAIGYGVYLTTNTSFGVVAAIFVFICVTIMRYYLDGTPKRTIDLSQPVRYRMVKGGYEKYLYQFWNPLKEDWWYIPDTDVGIHAPWSFSKQGSYGAYNLHKQSAPDGVSAESAMQVIQSRYPTYGSLQGLFDRLNQEHEQWQKKFSDWKNKPAVIS